MDHDLPEGADRHSTEKVKKKLIRELTDAIRTNLGDHIEAVAVSPEIVKVPANSNDPSIWASAGETIAHNDAFGQGHTSTVALAAGPRSFIRIIPGGWKRGGTVGPPEPQNGWSKIGTIDENAPLKPHASKRREHAIVGQRPQVGSRTRKYEATGAGHRMHFAQDRDGLSRLRHDMLDAHLHPLGADAPLAAIEVELLPFRGAKLAGPYEHHRCQPQRIAHDGRAVVGVDGTQQSCETHWISK